jgi:hypothetical protein
MLAATSSGGPRTITLELDAMALSPSPRFTRLRIADLSHSLRGRVVLRLCRESNVQDRQMFPCDRTEH